MRGVHLSKFNPKDFLKEQRIVKDINFLNHIGYFCHDPQKAKNLTEPIKHCETVTIQEERIEINYEILPVTKLGYPSVTAFQICDFIDRFLTYYGRPAKNPIPFEMKTLREFLGLQKSGQNDSTIKNALYQLRSTLINTTYFLLDRKNKKWFAGTMNYLKDLQVIGEGDELRAGLIYLDDRFLESFNNKNHLPVNYARYEDLPTPAKVLFLDFFRAFSAQRKQMEKKGELSATQKIEKDYNAIVSVLGFTPKTHKSQAKRQLTPHLDCLKNEKCQLIYDYDIENRKVKNGFKVVATAGNGFKEDYEEFNKNPQQLELQFKERVDKFQITAIEVVAYFYKQKSGLQELNAETGHLSEKEIILAKNFLKQLGRKWITNFIDYALLEAQKTNFDMKTFSATQGYFNEFLAKIQVKKKQEKEEKLRIEVIKKREKLEHLWEKFINEKYQKHIKILNKEKKEQQQQEIHRQALKNPFARNSYEKYGKEGVAYQAIINTEITNFTKTQLIQEEEFEHYLEITNNYDLIEIFLKK